MNFSKLKLFTTIAGPAQKKPDNPETGNKNNENVQLTNMLIIKLWKPCPEVAPSLSTVREDWRSQQRRLRSDHGRVKTFDDKKWHWEKGVGQLL